MKWNPIYYGFSQFYQKMKQFQLKTAVATNASIEMVERTDKGLNLTSLFWHSTFIPLTMSIIWETKSCHLSICSKQLGVHPEKCIAIEDSVHGILAAKAAGMFCIGL